MKIAVCDRNISDRRDLCLLLQEGFAARCVAVTAEPYALAEELYAECREELYEAIFLNIGEHGDATLDTARRLREMGYAGRLILTASSASFAVDGYEVGADGFLLKPYHTDRLIRILDRLTSSIHESGCLIILYHRTVVRVPYAEILFIESCNSKCVIHLQNDTTYVVYRRLSELEEELRDERFLRCHQSYLVNMDHIVKADRCFELINGDTVGIRQRELRGMRERFQRYLERRLTL